MHRMEPFDTSDDHIVIDILPNGEKKEITIDDIYSFANENVPKENQSQWIETAMAAKEKGDWETLNLMVIQKVSIY